MSDLIDRQAAIDAICEHGTELERRGITVLAVANHKQATVDLLESLPSVQPEPCEDAVSRSEIIRLILERGLYCDTQADRETSAEIIRQLPSVQSEIIRCGECKYWQTTWQNDWMPNYHYCPNVDGVRRNDFYCGDGERRTDE